MLQSPSKAHAYDFTATDYYTLSKDTFDRFKPAFSPYIAYAIVSSDLNEKPIAYQFDFPLIDDPKYTQVKKLKEITFGNGSDNTIIHAITVDGEEMRTHRHINIKTRSLIEDSKTYQLFFFSAISPYMTNQELTWPISEYHCKSIVESGKSAIATTQRGGELKIDFRNILFRWNRKLETEQTNEQTMERTARDAYIEFYTKNLDRLSTDFKRIIEKSFNNENPYNLKSSFASFKRPEWCHALAKHFHPLKLNPQVKTNIAAAPFWMNSQMMVFEEALKWHARIYSTAKIYLRSTFEVFEDSDVIQNGEMTGTVRLDLTEVEICQSLNPHQFFPAYPQSTDIALTTFVMNNLLLRIPPEVIPTSSSDYIIDDDSELDAIYLTIDIDEILAERSTTLTQLYQTTCLNSSTTERIPFDDRSHSELNFKFDR